jgi:hypothetical protein
MNQKTTYLAYGLGVSASFPLLFLPRTETRTDLTICYTGLETALTDPSEPSHIRWQQEGGEWVWEYWDAAGILLRFRFSAAGDALCIQYSQTEMGDLFPFLMGPGLGAALHLRGVPLLHGASVLIDDAAVLVSGLSGTGKSTLTAELVAAGLPLLTEDLTPLAFSGLDLDILPGYPALQLHADAALGLGYPMADCPKVYPGFADEDKHWLDLTRLPGGFHPAPAPLGMIYLLSGRRPDLKFPEFKPLPPTIACLALLEHLYGSRWLNLPPQQSLGLCARLAERVQVRRVWTPEGLDTVAITAQDLIADARACLTSSR